MGVFLGIDCSMRWTNIGVSDETGVLGEMNVHAGKEQAGMLPRMVDDLLRTRKLRLSDITVIGVTVGPGFFTGIRIGIAYSLGLSFSLDVRTIPVGSLEVMAQSFGVQNGIVAPILSASGGNVFGAVYRCEEGRLSPMHESGCFSHNEFSSILESIGANVRLLYQDIRLLDHFSERERSLWNVTPCFIRGGAVSELARRYSDRALFPSEIRARYHRAPDTGKK